MQINRENFDLSFNKIRERSSWNTPANQELRMHKIHVYPAKFPSFLISKALDYAKRKKIEINTLGDICCGCGTTALEAKKNNKEFWGCDINPVATLIAKVKRENYKENYLNKYYDKIIANYESTTPVVPKRILEHERIKYWFKVEQIIELHKLLLCIKKIVPKGKYQNFFLVAFSNILKKESKWLTKSIKPTQDPKKIIQPLRKVFKEQFHMMLKAVKEVNDKIENNPNAKIENRNFLKLNVDNPFLDMLITSTPYVTSYEYADLHQLSTLWLGYANDYRELRSGTIGSLYHSKIKDKDVESLNYIGKDIYENLIKVKHKKKPKAVLKYFIDIKNTINKSYSLINPGGLAVFVIGNTTYKGIYVDNAKYLTKCMLDEGFNEIEVFKRKISSKILSPYRDKEGKFSNNKRHRKVYSYEFVILAKKPL